MFVNVVPLAVLNPSDSNSVLFFCAIRVIMSHTLQGKYTIERNMLWNSDHKQAPTARKEPRRGLFAGIFSVENNVRTRRETYWGVISRRSLPVSGFHARMTEKAPEADERLPGQYFGRLRFREGGSVQEIRASHPRLPISAGARRFDLTKARQSAAASRSARTAAATSARVAESCRRRAVSVPAGS